MGEEHTAWLSVPPDAANADLESARDCDAIEYDDETETYRATFDSSTDSVAMVVVWTVAMITETDPVELPRLCSVVDPDALEILVRPAGVGPMESDVHASFTFHDCAVTVHSYGVVAVQPPRVDAES